MTDLQALSAGTLIAQRYAIETLLGMNDDGPVYRALDRHLQRRVTLRVFPSIGWEPGQRERFEADIRKATPLDHANLAGIRDFGTDRELGVGFVVYEPLNGVTLAMFLARRHPPAPVAALQIMHDVAEGVGAAHWAGLVHGEIHPETVFLAYSEVDRRVRIQLLLPGLPVGLGALADPSAAARYAAPEVLRGGLPTPASDVYSLGLVAYELLVGLPARWDETVRGSLPREELEIPPANEIRPEISGDIAEAVAGALHVDPQARFNDGNVFAIVLAHALDTSAHTPRLAAVFEGMPEFLREEFPENDALLTQSEPASRSAPAAAAPDRERKPAVTATTAAPATRPLVGSAPSATPVPQPRTWRLPAVAAALVAVLGIAGTAWSLASRDSGAPDAETADGSAPIAQFAASTPDPALDAPADGGTRPVEGVATDPEAGPARSSSAASAGVDSAAADEEEIPIAPAPAPLDIEPLAPIPDAALGDVAGADVSTTVPLPTPEMASRAAPTEEERASDGGMIYGQVRVDELPSLMNMGRLQRELRRLAIARAGTTEGTVLLQFVVLASGRVDTSSVQVLDSSSGVLRDAGREVINMAEFTPGKIEGSAVNVRVRMELALSTQDDD